SEVYLASGARKERSGDTKEAEALLRRSIEIDPANAPALNYLGYMLADRGMRLDEALSLVERALERDPDNGAYLDSLGWTYFKKGDFAEAERALDRARTEMANEPEIHEHLAELYFATGRVKEAMISWQKALDLGAPHADRIRARMSAAGHPADAPE